MRLADIPVIDTVDVGSTPDLVILRTKPFGVIGFRPALAEQMARNILRIAKRLKR